jgi:hypothetical protein
LKLEHRSKSSYPWSLICPIPVYLQVVLLGVLLLLAVLLLAVVLLLAAVLLAAVLLAAVQKVAIPSRPRSPTAISRSRPA